MMIGSTMDGSSFDRISRRMAVSTSRRGGVVALVAGALGIAGFSATEAVVPVPPLCRSTGMECSDSLPCCSGRCIVKRDGTSRCARKTSNRKKKEKEKDDQGGGGGGGGDTCIAEGDACPLAGCCTDLICYPNSSASAVCKTCGEVNDYCNEQTAPCCNSHTCEYRGGPGPQCCVNLGQSCNSPQDCCGYGSSATCVSGTCQVT